jgi:hydroxymethylpyrimidine pyrophosphatase-like HAD family hydrolase
MKLFGKLELEIENLKNNGGYLLMDVDGCLIEGGLETVGNQKTLKEWSQENQKNIHLFRQNIASLKNIGLRVGLSTGRGMEFSKRLIDCLFSKETGITLDKSIVEGGLIIYDGLNGIEEISNCVNKESANLLRDNRDKIIDLGVSCGGAVEEGKILGVSFNPPIGLDGKRDTDVFREILKKKIGQDLINGLIITNSSTAVDITPVGVDKMTAMESLVGSRSVIYLGDGRNDETSMRNSKVKINLAPANSHEVIKKLVSSGEKPGLISSEPELKGTNQMFEFLITKF